MVNVVLIIPISSDNLWQLVALRAVFARGETSTESRKRH